MPQWLKYNATSQHWHAKLDPDNEKTLCGVYLKQWELYPLRVLVDYVPREDKSELCTECLVKALGVEEWKIVPNEGTAEGA